MPDNSDPNAINPVPVTPIFGETPPTEPAPPTLPSMDSDVPPPPEPTGGAGPVGDLQGLGIPPVITPSKPKGRVSRRMVATILGILVLVGGLGAGVVLVQQQQDIRERAATTACKTDANCDKGYVCKSGTCVLSTTPSPKPTPNCTIGSCYENCLCRGNSDVECRAGCPTATPTPPPCPSGSQCQGIANQNECVLNRSGTWQSCSGAGGTGTGLGTCCVPGGTGGTVTCQTGQIVCKGSCVDPRYDSSNCGSCGRACAKEERCWANECVSTTTTQLCPTGYTSGGRNRDAAEEACEGVCGVRETPTANRICENATIVNAGTAMVPNWCYDCKGTGGGTITETTPPPPGGEESAQCLAVQAFDSSWTLLTADKLSTLNVGDIVRFAIGGTATTGTNDKAKFKINGVDRSEVTQKRPGTDEYYDEYTVPEGVSSFTIGAQLHNTVLGWF